MPSATICHLSRRSTYFVDVGAVRIRLHSDDPALLEEYAALHERSRHGHEASVAAGYGASRAAARLGGNAAVSETPAAPRESATQGGGICGHVLHHGASGDLRHTGTRRADVGEKAIEVTIRRSRRTWWRSPRFEVRANGNERFRGLTRAEVLPFVDWAINWEIPGALPHLAQFHAASLSRDGLGVILAGESGAGKSTLAAGLIRAGWQYLCDEFALVGADTLCLHSYPKALCIKKPAFAALEAAGVSIGDRPWHLKGGKGSVVILPPNQIRPGSIGRPCPVRLVVFPRYVEGASPSLTPIGRADAVDQLHRVCFNLLSCRAMALSVMTRMIRGAECYRLVSGSLAASTSMLDALIESRRAALAESA